MTFERTTDYELIREVMTHPKLWPWVSDDHSPPREEYRAVEDERIVYLLVRHADEILGLFALVPHTPVLWEVHTRILPCAWGTRAAEAARGLLAWLWQNTSCRRLMTNVPAYNRLALKFARAAGLQQFGLNERSYLHQGKLHDQVLLGISKPEEI